MITHNEARKQIQSTNEYLETNIDPFGSFETYITQQEKKDELLELYRLKERCIVCAPYFEGSRILHCAVPYTDNEKYMTLLKQTQALEEELK